MKYISEDFKTEFPEHFGNEVGDIKEMVLYQFQCAQDEYIETIIKNRLYISNPAKFNDPFDSLITLKNDLNDELDIRVDIHQSILQHDASHIGVVCLTSSWKNQLMWSHYAESHKGMCLKFQIDVDHNQLKQKGFILEPIQYKGHAPLSTRKVLEDNNIDITDSKYIRALLCTKNSCWHYEREWRLISKSENNGKPMPLNDVGISLREIIFGIKMPSWKIDAICRAVIENGIQPSFSRIEFDYSDSSLKKTSFNYYV